MGPIDDDFFNLENDVEVGLWCENSTELKKKCIKLKLTNHFDFLYHRKLYKCIVVRYKNTVTNLYLHHYPRCCGITVLCSIQGGFWHGIPSADRGRVTEALTSFVKGFSDDNCYGVVELVDAADYYKPGGGRFFDDNVPNHYRLEGFHTHLTRLGWKMVKSFVNPNSQNQCKIFHLYN